MNSKNVYDKRKVKLEEIMKEGYIPFLEGRPRRDKIIKSEDLVDLIIALETCETLEEFLQKV